MDGLVLAVIVNPLRLIYDRTQNRSLDDVNKRLNADVRGRQISKQMTKCAKTFSTPTNQKTNSSDSGNG